MLYSMTGYGRAIKIDKNFTLTVEIRSLNSKYFDINNSPISKEHGIFSRFIFKIY